MLHSTWLELLSGIFLLPRLRVDLGVPQEKPLAKFVNFLKAPPLPVPTQRYAFGLIDRLPHATSGAGENAEEGT